MLWKRQIPILIATVVGLLTLFGWFIDNQGIEAFVNDDAGFRIGSEVKVKLQKSRFGTEGRIATFKILWGSDVGIQDEESWLTAIKLSGTDRMKQAGAWYTLIDAKGKEHKFQASKWKEKLQEESFRKVVYDIMDQEIIHRFDHGGGEIKIED